MIPRTTVLAFVLCALALPAAAQIHRWVDEQGRVHYGDRPLGATGSTLRIRAESATVPGARAAQVVTAPHPAVRAEAPAKPAKPAKPVNCPRGALGC